MFQHSSVSIRKPNYLTNWEKYLYYAIDKETNPMEPFGFGFGSSSVLEIEIVGLDSFETGSLAELHTCIVAKTL